jgi:hypothetical protein
MLAALGSIIMIITTIVPLVFTVAKAFPSILRFFRTLFAFSRGGAILGRSGFWGIAVAAVSLVGGFGFFISIYFGWGFEFYLKFFDLVFTPFSYVVEELIRSFIRQLPSLPPNSASVLCLFDFSRCFTLLMLGFGFEVYMRVLIYFLVRRGR